jgi:hypothetical protein
MKYGWLAIVAVALPLAAQDLDLKWMEKYESKASKSSHVMMDPDQIGLIKGEADKDLSKLKKLVVRSLQFDQEGAYDMAEAKAFRDRVVAQGGWTSIVSVQEKREFTEIMIKKGADGTAGGMLILAAEPKELTVVHMDGLADLKELGKLSGKMGVPQIHSAIGGSAPRARAARPGKPSKPAPPASPAPPAPPAPAKKEIE